MRPWKLEEGEPESGQLARPEGADTQRLEAFDARVSDQAEKAVLLFYHKCDVWQTVVPFKEKKEQAFSHPLWQEL